MSKLARRSSLALGILALAIVSDPSPKTHQPAGAIPTEIQNVLAAYGAGVVMIDHNAREFKLPEQIEWKGRPGGTAQSVILAGDPSKPGLYVQLLKRAPNDWSKPHSHPHDRFITVLAGTMYIGTGSKADHDNTVALKQGSFLRDIADQMHYDGTGPEGLTLEIVGIGPTE